MFQGRSYQSENNVGMLLHSHIFPAGAEACSSGKSKMCAEGLEVLKLSVCFKMGE